MWSDQKIVAQIEVVIPYLESILVEKMNLANEIPCFTQIIFDGHFPAEGYATAVPRRNPALYLCYLPIR